VFPSENQFQILQLYDIIARNDRYREGPCPAFTNPQLAEGRTEGEIDMRNQAFQIPEK
jgi:hypothetical protein